MPTELERLSVVETKIENIEKKLDGVSIDIRDLHDCLDRTRDLFLEKMDELKSVSEQQHQNLENKFNTLDRIKDRWAYTFLGALAIFGWIWPSILDMIRSVVNG